MLEELLAQIRAAQSSGMGETGLQLTKTATGERSALQKYFNAITGAGSDAETKDIGRKRRRSKFRLGGSILGAIALTALTGGAAAPHLAARIALGAGGGSLLGSKAAQSTQAGGWRLKGVTGDAPTGMFLGAERERAGGKARDLQRYVTEANKSFDQAQYVNALTDAWNTYRLATMPKTEGFLSNLFKGDIGGDMIDTMPEELIDKERAFG
tara:strand:- start:2099 stop:2731 length:633 start_codon:yes stop_codon:yes gene_type:complete